MVILIYMDRLWLFYKSVHNPVIGGIMLSSFLRWYWKPSSYKLLLCILPLLFSNKIFNKLINSNSNSTFYSLFPIGLTLDIKNEAKLTAELTKLSIIFWYSNEYFLINNNLFTCKNNENIDDTWELKKFIKASKMLWVIFSKIKNENEIFYHLLNY